MLRLIILAMFALSAAVASAASKECVTNSQRYDELVSKTSKPLRVSAFKGINKRWTMQRILKQLGPAARDIGSGVHILEWDVSDGRVFSVSTASFCGKPMAVGFHPHPRKGLTQ